MKIKKDKLEGKSISKEIKSYMRFTKTNTDHVTVFIIQTLGSMGFLLFVLILFAVWIAWNLHFFNLKPFDPFPFPILTMVVSLFAIVLSVSVLINQNRQSRIEKIRQQVEFEINVRAENEITKMLIMLDNIQKKLGLNENHDRELEEMKQRIDIQELHQALDGEQEKIE